MIEREGWVIERQDLLTAETPDLQAVLCPSEENEFTFVYDPTPRSCDEWERVAHSKRGEIEEALARFRLAHELAHTKRYTRGLPPTRRTRPNLAEEEWCDRWAAELLVPPELAHHAVESNATDVVDLARRMKAPVECVLRAAGCLPGDDINGEIGDVLAVGGTHVGTDLNYLAHFDVKTYFPLLPVGEEIEALLVRQITTSRGPHAFLAMRNQARGVTVHVNSI